MTFSYLTLLHVITLLAVALRIFSQRNTKGSAPAWLLLVVLLPVFGVLIYLLIGGAPPGAYLDAARRRIAAPGASMGAGHSWRHRGGARHPEAGAQSICRRPPVSGRMPLLGGHRLQLLSDSVASMRALIADIDASGFWSIWSSTLECRWLCG